MGVFEDAVVRMKAVADSAGKKACEVMEVQKLKMTVSQIEAEIKNKYEVLGKLTYNAQKDGKNATEASKALAEDIEELYAQLSVLKEKIYRLKNIVCCPKCHAINAKDALFCNKCGEKLAEDPFARKKAEPKEEPDVPGPDAE